MISLNKLDTIQQSNRALKSGIDDVKEIYFHGKFPCVYAKARMRSCKTKNSLKGRNTLESCNHKEQ